MIYEMRLLRALLQPQRTFFQLAKAERIERLGRALLWLFIASAAIFFLSGWFGIGSQVLSPLLVRKSSVEYESVKSFFLVGRLLLGLLYPCVVLFLPALYFWTFSDERFGKFVALQAFVLPILLLEQVSFIILVEQFHLPWFSSPLSFGVITQAITEKKFLIYLFGAISLFKIWVMVIQYRGLQALTKLNAFLRFLLVFFINAFGWAATAALAFINFDILL